MARRLDSIAPPNISASGIAFLLYIKNLSVKDIGKSLLIRVMSKTSTPSLCGAKGIDVIWQKSIPINDDQMLVLIDKKFDKGIYTISINYKNSSVSRTITKYDSSRFTIGLPYSSYPPFELLL